MAEEVTSLVYPPYIRDYDAYEHRKMFIEVIKPVSFAESVEDALNTAIDKAKEIGSALTESSAGNVDKTINNMKNNEDSSGDHVITIVLPLPNELTDTQQHDWSTEKGIFGTVLGGIESQSVAEAAGGKIADVISRAAGAIPLVGAGISAGAGMEVQHALGAMTDSAGMRKPLADPGYFQNYTGSQPRNFDMTFDFTPNNPEEAKEIFAIIMALKEFSSPETKGVTLLAPHYFNIDFSNDYVSKLAGLHGVVLQNIVINYGADGAMQQYPDGTPKYIQMGLTFVERKMRTAADYRKKV